MIFDAFIFLIGLIIGFATGLVPGLHPNLISAIVILQDIDYEKKALLIVSMYAGNSVFSLVPAIFFGVPDAQTAVSVLPGQRMMLDGNGIAALKAGVAGLLVASFAGLLLMPFAFEFYVFTYPLVKHFLAPILLLASALSVLKTKNPYYSLAIFLASGLFGAYAFNLDMRDVFLPMFSGFFTMGAILNYRKTKVPAQKESAIEFGILKYGLLGALLGAFANLIPAISSPAQVAALAAILISFESPNYLATVAAIGAGQFVFAFASSASIGKTRHGVVAHLAEILDIGANMKELALAFVVGTGICALALYFLRKRIAVLASVDFSKFNILLAIYLAIIVLLIDGLLGLAIFWVASLIGLATIRMGVERTMMMGGLIVPTLILLLKG